MGDASALRGIQVEADGCSFGFEQFVSAFQIFDAAR